MFSQLTKETAESRKSSVSQSAEQQDLSTVALKKTAQKVSTFNRFKLSIIWIVRRPPGFLLMINNQERSINKGNTAYIM